MIAFYVFGLEKEVAYLNLCLLNLYGINQGFETISRTTASLSWGSVRLTAVVNMVAVDCLVHLNSLMHVAGAGLLSQHG